MNVPNLPIGEFINEKRELSDVGRKFFEQLITELQNNFGQEGLVAPPQSSTDITKIQNHLDGDGNPTCPLGNFLYNSTANSIQVTINNGSDTPIFKTVTLT